MDNDEEFRREVRENFMSIRESISELVKKTTETNTTIIMRGGVLDRLDNVEKCSEKTADKTSEVRAELNTIKAKVAFAAACISSLIAAAWSIVTHFWKQ